ncbi:MAG: hypothetical protein F9K19_20530 [Rhizobiaceae bacterium]|nr:MAG: hypothetical protein F9K19_20530 [Rhizobiaceae bacterium]
MAMDWDGAIERYSEALRRIVAMMVAMAGAAGAGVLTSPLRGGRAEGAGESNDAATTPTRPSDDGRPPLKGEVETARPTLPRHLYRAVLAILRPAESAARRLMSSPREMWPYRLRDLPSRSRRSESGARPASSTPTARGRACAPVRDSVHGSRQHSPRPAPFPPASRCRSATRCGRRRIARAASRPPRLRRPAEDPPRKAMKSARSRKREIIVPAPPKEAMVTQPRRRAISAAWKTSSWSTAPRNFPSRSTMSHSSWMRTSLCRLVRSISARYASYR